MSHLSSIESVQTALGVRLNDHRLLQTALEPYAKNRGSSRGRGRGKPKRHRTTNTLITRSGFHTLALLGDAAINLALIELKQGSMSEIEEIRSNRNLARVFDGMGLMDFLSIRRHDLRKTQGTGEWIKASVYEAIVGAIHLDQGYETAREFVKRTLLTEASEAS